VSRKLGRRLALAGLPALLILHNDFWLWDDPRFLLGLPVGLTYHALFCLAATGVMVLLLRRAWPAHLEVEEESSRPEEARR